MQKDLIKILNGIDWDKVSISVDVSKDDNDFYKRVFAKCIDIQVNNSGDVILLCEEESRNF